MHGRDLTGGMVLDGLALMESIRQKVTSPSYSRC
jgi:hypothetical protein